MPFKDLQVSLILCDNIHDPFKPEQKLSEHVELAQFAIGSSKPDMKWNFCTVHEVFILSILE